MKPQTGKALIDRFIHWLRGMWSEAAKRRSSGQSGSDTDRNSATQPSDRPGSTAGPGDDDVAANGSPDKETGGGTGASQDEFATGGYTPDNPDLGTVEDAAGTRPETGERQGDASSVTDSDVVDLSEAAIPDDTESRQPGVVEAGEPDETAPGLGGTAGDEALSTIDEMNVRGIGDLGAEELGSLEELDEDALAFEADASERYDANSEPGFAADVPDSFAEIGHETDDYESAAAQDSGLRIVDEDEADLSMRVPADAEFVDPGSVIDEPAEVTEDARPLGDYTQVRSGIANEADEPVSVAGDRSTDPFGSETGMDTAQTWTDGLATENLGAAGELGAVDFGSTVGEGEREVDSTGLDGPSDIDVADLSYLDESEDARFDFSEASAGMPESAGVVDDIGPSPTGVRDSEGAVESDLQASNGPEPGQTLIHEDLPESVSTVTDDIADSPTGVVDTDATTRATGGADDAITGAREHVPLPTAERGATGPGGSVRGDDSGNCPADFPIKGNSSSKIYHVPDIPSYQGTKAEWCFATEEQAQGAGYRPPGQRNRGAGGRSSSGSNSGRGGRSRGSSSR